MQQAFHEVKQNLWSRLKPFFQKFAGEEGQISNSDVQILVRDIFGQASNQDIDYIVKNMHRLDVDESGKVSFPQFANFLFQKHCGEMSLQKRHIRGQMKRGSERLISQEQFEILLNSAVKFLNYEIPKEVSTQIFINTDKDKDGYINYVQYFQAIREYICKSTQQLQQKIQIKVIEPVEPKVIEQPQRIPKPSRLRLWIWRQLGKLYQNYILGRKVLIQQIRQLVISIVGDLTQLELVFIITGLYKMETIYIEFIPFAVRFLLLIAQVGISRFSSNHDRFQRRISLQQFIILFSNTYKFLCISGINVKFLELVYYVIRGNKQYVTFQSYLYWIRTFLAIAQWYGDQFVFPQDDPDNHQYDSIFYPTKVTPDSGVKQITIVKFEFSNNQLAYKVRQRMFNLLIKYDKNNDQLFSQQQIRLALTDLLKQNQIELDYVTRNVFRYDRDGDRNVTYDQLTNFSVQQHFGEMAIQRLHRKKFYTKGALRIMNQEEFAKTLNYALNFIQIQATQIQIQTLFKQIDLDNDGWISYQVYFLFLKYYFGSLSVAFFKPNIPTNKPASFKTILLQSLQSLSPLDRFIKLLLQQLRFIFNNYDENKNLSFQPNQIQAILIHVFNFNHQQTQLIMFEIFRVDARYQNSISFQDLVAIILSIYFIHIWLLKRYQNIGKKGWKQRKISLQQFIILITQGCYFVVLKPFQQDLIGIFNMLDTDQDGYITFLQYVEFIRKYIGRNLAIQDQPPTIQSPVKVKDKVPGIPDQQIDFVQAIWSELKMLFDRYGGQDKGYLNQSQFKSFAVQILNQKSDNQLKYIFWNLFRLDSDFDKKIEFEEFAPYVLKHAGEISLQRFHIQQAKGKNTLSEDELFLLISNAYGFLATMPKSRSIVKIIFKRLQKNQTVGYGNYLTWIDRAISKRFR